MLFLKLNSVIQNLTIQLSSSLTVGIGGAVNKAISTAELLKKDLDLHQTNTIYFVTITEVWIPKDNQVFEVTICPVGLREMSFLFKFHLFHFWLLDYVLLLIIDEWQETSPQNLQNIEVERKVPAISIRLDVDEPAEKQLGYQPPELKSSPDKPIPRQSKFKKFSSKPKEKEDYPFPNHQKHLESKYRPRKQHKNGDREQTSNYKGKQKSKKKFNGNQRENGVFDRNSGKGDTESPVHNSKSSIHDQSINQDNGQEQTAMEQ